MCCRKCLEHQLPNGDVNVLLEMFGEWTAQLGRHCAVENVWSTDYLMGTSLCCWKCLEHRLLNWDVNVLLPAKFSYMDYVNAWALRVCVCVCVCACVRVCNHRG